MPNFNKVMLMGHLTKDPDVRTITSTGTIVASTSIAVSNRYKEKEETMFIEISAFSKTAEIMGEYCRKGSAVMIEGTLKQNVWEDNGVKRSKHTVLVERLIMLGSGKKDNQNTETEDDVPFGIEETNPQPATSAPQKTAQARPQKPQAKTEEVYEDFF